MQRHHLLREQILCEELLDPVRAVRSDGYLHGQRGADHLADGRDLIAVKVDGQQQEHLTQRGAGPGALAKEGIFADQPLQPLHRLVLQRNGGHQRGAGDEHAQGQRHKPHARGRGLRTTRDQLGQGIDLVVVELETTNAAEGTVQPQQHRSLQIEVTQLRRIGRRLDHLL